MERSAEPSRKPALRGEAAFQAPAPWHRSAEGELWWPSSGKPHTAEKDKRNTWLLLSSPLPSSASAPRWLNPTGSHWVQNRERWPAGEGQGLSVRARRSRPGLLSQTEFARLTNGNDNTASPMVWLGGSRDNTRNVLGAVTNQWMRTLKVLRSSDGSLRH